MKRLLFLLFLFTSLSGFAQDKIPVNKYKSTFWSDVNEKFIGTDPNLSHFRLTAAYSRLNFLNQNFSENINDDKLKQNFGFLVGIEYFFKYFKLGVRYSNNTFEIIDPQLANFNADKLEIKSNGVESKIDLMLLPQIKHFSLFVGGGYSHQWMTLDVDTDEEKKSYGEPIWDVGFDIYISQHFNLFGEYTQTIDTKSDNAFNRFNAGIGYSF